MFCKSCGTGIKPGAKFCPKCGTTVAAQTPQQEAGCISCGKAIKPSAKFCPHCGVTQQAVSDGQALNPVPAPVHAPLPEVEPVAAAPVRPVASQASVAGSQSAQSTMLAQASIAPPVPPQPIAPKIYRPAPAVKNPATVPQSTTTSPSSDTTAKKRCLIWVASGLALVATAGGIAWYVLGTLYSQENTSAASQAAAPAITAPTPAQAEAEPTAPSPEPPPLTAQAAPPAVANEASAPKPLTQPSPKATSTAPAAKQPAWAAPTSKPAQLHPESREQARLTTQPTAPEQPAQFSFGPTWAEPSKETVSNETNTAKDPFAKCRKMTGYFERFVCEEKTRWKICQGKWGTTPECPKYNNESPYEN